MQTDTSSTQYRIKKLEEQYYELKTRNTILQEEKLDDMENMRKLHKMELALEERVRELQAKKMELERSLDDKEHEITRLNYKIEEFKAESEKRKEEFGNQRKKLDSLAKNFNEMKMERAKLQRRIKTQLRNTGGDAESQSCASLSEDSDGNGSKTKKSSKFRPKGFEDGREDGFSIQKSAITPIEESDNEEEGHPRKMDVLSKKTTTFSKPDQFEIDYDESSISDVGSPALDNSMDFGFSSSRVVKTKDSTSILRKSSSRMKDYSRMGTVRSDSSSRSRQFRFRSKAGKANAIVQTDKQFFQAFLKSKMNQLLREVRLKARNKYVQTEEEISKEEEERQKELLATYGHKLNRSGGSGVRGSIYGESNEIKYANIPMVADIGIGIIHEETSYIETLSPLDPSNSTSKPRKSSKQAKVISSGSRKTHILDMVSPKNKKAFSGSLKRTVMNKKSSTANVLGSMSFIQMPKKEPANKKRFKMHKKNTSQNLIMSLNPSKIEDITQSMGSLTGQKILVDDKESLSSRLSVTDGGRKKSKFRHQHSNTDFSQDSL